ncbi:MAG: glycosyltransferase [bacterium]
MRNRPHQESMRRLGRREGIYSLIVPLIFYTSLSLSIWYAMWPYFYYIKDESFIILGVFAMWRYGWQITNYVRSFIYTWWKYPRLKKSIKELPEQYRYPEHIFFIIPSYKEEPWVSIEAFQSILSNLSEIPSSATLIVATGSDRDDQVIAQVYQAHPVHHKVELVLQRQSQGKRIAMGHALRALARRYDGEHNSVTLFMDGDSFLPVDTLRKCLPFFARYKKLGAVTTNESAYINTRSIWYKEWFNLKFGQRHILFKSHSLSNKVLTLTGRFSLFRTNIIASEAFIRQIENDQISHWMHGKFRFLMGDDKSSWFYLLKQGWNMLYLPDVAVYSLESRDDPFLKVSLSLPYRWYGNTLRNNSRALKLGWRKIGAFIWYAILDQRFTMWTSLVGITGAVLLSLTKSFIYLPFYLGWVILIRTFQMIIIAFRGHPVSLLTVPLMLYNQWVGSVIKIRAMFNLADQSWAKGGTVQAGDKNHVPVKHWLAKYMPRYTMTLALSVFFFILLIAQGVLNLPDWPDAKASQIKTVFNAANYGVIANDGKDDAKALNFLLNRLRDFGPVEIRLPKGQLNLDQALIIEGDQISIIGHAGGTSLTAQFEGKNQGLINVMGSQARPISSPIGKVKSKQTHLVWSKAPPLKKGDMLVAMLPNDEHWFASLKSSRWNKKYPYLRQQAMRVMSIRGRQVELDNGPGFDVDATQGKWRVIDPVEQFRLENVVLSYSVKGEFVESTRDVYENLFPENALDGLNLKGVDQCFINNVTVHSAGRHPVNLEYARHCKIQNIQLLDAWNKGVGGMGYLRIARSFDNKLNNIRIKNLRHLSLQWSSSGNVIQQLDSTVDINFHGGYSHDNRVKHARINLSNKHKWPAVFRTPNNAHWAPPDGQNNLVQDCLWKQGQQEWQVCE